MSRHRAPVPHAHTRPVEHTGRRLLVEAAALAALGILLVLLGVAVLLATALATVVAP